MIDYLISVGITQFGVVDFDIVDITNFNRQFKYKENDIGHSKITQLKENLNTQYKNLIIVPYEKKISSTLELKEIIEDYNPLLLYVQQIRQYY
jgi:molybdopterin/thiamine biosynthesis adenylyltransferase